MKKIYFIALILSLFLSACNTSLSASDHEIMLAPTATIPPGKDARDIYINQENLNTIKNIAANNPNGSFLGMFATYDEQFVNTDNAYHVTSDKGFMGQAWIFNPSDQEHKFALICLLDYQQVPCSPEQTLENIITVTAQTEHFVSMYLSQLTAGLHDLGLLIIREPYQNIDTGLNHSSTDLSLFSASNIYVDDSTTPPEITPLSIPHEQGLKDYSKLFYASKSPELLEPNGLIRIWELEESQAGGWIDFYLHFNWQEDRKETNVAMMAFINYKQVPIYYENTPHFPLYINRETKSLQTLPVRIQVPNEPGVYELYLTAVSHPFEPQEINGEYVSKMHQEESRPIRLEVLP